jgi:hypothetical protein
MIGRLKERLKSKKFLRKFLLAAIVLTALIAASIYTVFIKPRLSEDRYIYKEEQVQRGDLILGIMESGNITLDESSINYTLELEDEDDDDEDSDDEDDDEEETIKYLEIEDVYAVSGQHIKEGDELFKLTEKSVEAVGKRLNTLYTETQIALSEAETEYKIELLTAKGTYDTSIMEANKAKSSYNSSQSMTEESVNILSADIKVLEADIAYAQEQLADEDLWESLDDAQTEYTQALNIYEDTDVHNATAYASNYADYKSAREQLDMIQGQIDELNQTIEDSEKSITEKQKDIAAAQSGLEVEGLTNKGAYNNAVVGGELAEDIYNYTVNSLKEAVASAQADTDEAAQNLEDFQSFVGEDGIIYADGSGVVTSVSYKAGDDLIAAGAILSYVKEDAYAVTIDVSEEDVSAIAVGDTVDIVMAAYPDEVYEGTVDSITTTATSDYASTISYPVTIKIEGDISLLFGGMTADVTFVTDSVSDVLYISKKAVQEIDGKSYVYTKGQTGNKKLIEVETGFSDGTNIEIVSGLSEGDIVYIESKVSASDEELSESGIIEQSGSGDGSGQEMSGDGIMPDAGDFSGGENIQNGGGFPGNGGNMPDMSGGFPGN